MNKTLFYLSLSGKEPKQPLSRKLSLARDCNNHEELKKLKKFNAMFGTNIVDIKLPKHSY